MLTGRTAVVTGASRGIGAATARALAAAGARVALVARGADALDALATALGAGHLAVPADCTKADDVARLADAVQAWAGGAPDILVNNAGSYPRATLLDQDPDEFAATLDLNLAAPFRVLHAFLPAMRARRSGHVVSIGTVADRNIWPMNGAYSASKFGLRALHEVLYAESRGSGVRATLIAPGAVDTGIWDAHEAELGKTLAKRTAMLRPDDVARAVLFAVSQPAHMAVHELRLSPA
jgi:NADP-dependent 3-hydroxy acid dehydrogenase YdfG